MKKTLTIFIAILLCLTTFTACKKAEGDTTETTKEYSYTSFTKDGTTDFPETIEINGQTYQITSTYDINTTGSEEIIQKEQPISVESKDDIPNQMDYEINGQTYTFDLAETEVQQGLVEITKTVTNDYTQRTTKPTDCPETAPITVTVDGEEKELEGKLVSVQQTSDYAWSNDLVVSGVWEGLPQSNKYKLQGTNTVISYDAAKPIWKGYENDILKGAGLSSNYFRISDGQWTSKGETVNNKFTRQASYYGSQYTATFTATYKASYQTQGYYGTAYYRVPAKKVPNASANDKKTLYTIKAVVTYKLVETTKK